MGGRWMALLVVAACAGRGQESGAPPPAPFVAPAGTATPWPPGAPAEAPAAGVSSRPPAPPSTAIPAPPPPLASEARTALVEALRHDWGGPYGTIDVDERGAVVTLHVCPQLPSSDPSRCPALEAEGALTVKKWSFVVGTTELAAFVHDGRLHVAKQGAVVGRLDEARAGTIALSYFLSLTVGQSCSARSGERTSPVPCAFEERGDHTWFVATVGGVKRELIYLSGPRILASPELVHQAFEPIRGRSRSSRLEL